MRLWLSKNDDVPLREQLVRQIMLGVVSGDLRPGERLPSTRELARRFRIHHNTVSAAFRDLERAGWLDFHKGSRVYVRRLGADAPSPTPGAPAELDGLISAFFTLARGHGFSLAAVNARLRCWLERQPPDHFLVVEPDETLREILMAEVAEAAPLGVSGASPEECSDPGILAGAAVVALYSKAEDARRHLPAGVTPILLHTRSIPDALRDERRPAPEALVTVVSRWPMFLEWARVFLVAAGVDAGSLDLRDARNEGWERGLRSSDYVITETLTAKRLPREVRPRVYRVVADASLEELRAYVEHFLADTPVGEVAAEEKANAFRRG